MRFLLAIPAIVVVGFFWQLGRDAARAVRVRRVKAGGGLPKIKIEIPAPRVSAPRHSAHWQTLYLGEPGAARWTVQ